MANFQKGVTCMRKTAVNPAGCSLFCLCAYSMLQHSKVTKLAGEVPQSRAGGFVTPVFCCHAEGEHVCCIYTNIGKCSLLRCRSQTPDCKLATDLISGSAVNLPARAYFCEHTSSKMWR